MWLVTVERLRCFGRFSEEAMENDSTVNHYVCKDKEACTLRMPAGGRKRTRPEGGDAGRRCGGGMAVDGLFLYTKCARARRPKEWAGS